MAEILIDRRFSQVRDLVSIKKEEPSLVWDIWGHVGQSPLTAVDGGESQKLTGTAIWTSVPQPIASSGKNWRLTKIANDGSHEKQRRQKKTPKERSMIRHMEVD